ncbi:MULTISPECIES: hypothetical protein [unclassified Microcoleus]
MPVPQKHRNLYQVWVKYFPGFLVRLGGLCMCSSGFKQRSRG